MNGFLEALSAAGPAPDAPASFLWRADVSADGEKNWKRVAAFRARRR